MPTDPFPIAKTRSSLLKDVLRELQREREKAWLAMEDPEGLDSDWYYGYAEALEDVYERMEK